MSMSISDQVAIQQIGDGEYVSKFLPIRLGNSMPIAYGGCTIAIAVNAACSTVSPGMSLYSVLGHFHGPASTGKKLYSSVTKTRDTRSFATRRVQVTQQQSDGKFRVCLELLADFHVKEPSTLIYSEPINQAWSRPEDCPTVEMLIENLLDKGIITRRQGDEWIKIFGPHDEFFETRGCTEGVSNQNLSGAAKTAVTNQDDCSITEKKSAEWLRAKGTLTSQAENLSALAFLMDGGLTFLPLSHNHMWFDDITACSTLDFALRIFVPEVNIGNWHVRERKTSRGGSGRTFSEGKLWDQHGNLVASNSQQSILRLKEGSSRSKF